MLLLDNDDNVNDNEITVKFTHGLVTHFTPTRDFGPQDEFYQGRNRRTHRIMSKFKRGTK